MPGSLVLPAGLKLRGFKQQQREPTAEDGMALAALLAKASDHNAPREMIGHLTQRLMPLDVKDRVDAGHGRLDAHA